MDRDNIRTFQPDPETSQCVWIAEEFRTRHRLQYRGSESHQTRLAYHRLVEHTLLLHSLLPLSLYHFVPHN